jgi:hypothetical protein
VSKTKTDNSYLMDKVMLRVKNLPEGEISVLDCFAGKGLIWAAVENLSGRKVKVMPIDKRPDKDDFHLYGDNLEYLETLDLSRFRVVDLDSYGSPFRQLEVLFRRKYKGTVFVTMILDFREPGPDDMLIAIGFTKDQIEKASPCFCKRSWEYFLQYLAVKGVKKIRHRSTKRKHYLALTMA